MKNQPEYEPEGSNALLGLFLAMLASVAFLTATAWIVCQISKP